MTANTDGAAGEAAGDVSRYVAAYLGGIRAEPIASEEPAAHAHRAGIRAVIAARDEDLRRALLSEAAIEAARRRVGFAVVGAGDVRAAIEAALDVALGQPAAGEAKTTCPKCGAVNYPCQCEWTAADFADMKARRRDAINERDDALDCLADVKTKLAAETRRADAAEVTLAAERATWREQHARAAAAVMAGEEANEKLRDQRNDAVARAATAEGELRAVRRDLATLRDAVRPLVEACRSYIDHGVRGDKWNSMAAVDDIDDSLPIAEAALAAAGGAAVEVRGATGCPVDGFHLSRWRDGEMFFSRESDERVRSAGVLDVDGVQTERRDMRRVLAWLVEREAAR